MIKKEDINKLTNTNNTFHILFSNVINTSIHNLTSGDKSQYFRANEIIRYFCIYLLTMSKNREKIIKKLGIKNGSREGKEKSLFEKLNSMHGKKLFLFFSKLLDEAGIKPIYQKPLLNENSFFQKMNRIYIQEVEKNG